VATAHRGERARIGTELRTNTEFWIELPQVESDRISELAVLALRDIYGVQHPVFLAPDQLAEALQPTRRRRDDSSVKVVEVDEPIFSRPCRATSNISTTWSMPSLPRYTAIADPRRRR
jgi:hypothetical protein